MSSVWVVRDVYNNYVTRAIFSTQKGAEEYINFHLDINDNSTLEIQEHGLDPRPLKILEQIREKILSGHKTYEVTVSRKGIIAVVPVTYRCISELKNAFKSELVDYKNNKIVMCFALDEKHAKQIALEKYKETTLNKSI